MVASQQQTMTGVGFGWGLGGAGWRVQKSCVTIKLSYYQIRWSINLLVSNNRTDLFFFSFLMFVSFDFVLNTKEVQADKKGYNIYDYQ